MSYLATQITYHHPVIRPDNDRSKNDWFPGWLWKLLSFFPQYSLNMHTFPSERDMDRAVRGTPSSAAGGNREEPRLVLRVGSSRKQIAETKPRYLWARTDPQGMSQGPRCRGHWIWHLTFWNNHLQSGFFWGHSLHPNSSGHYENP